MRSEYTDELVLFVEAHVREWYLFESGRKLTLDLEPVFDRFGYLFSVEDVDSVRRAAEAAFTERERKALRYVRAFAIESHVAAKTRQLTEAIADHQARATVEWTGARIPFNAVARAVASEARSSNRNELSARGNRIVEETNDLREERLEVVRDAASALGAESYHALLGEARGIDYHAVVQAADALLSRTERAFVEALELALAARASVRLADATDADAAYCFRSRELDRWFPTAKMRTIYRDVLGGLGIRSAAQSNVILDLEDRPTKRIGAFCAPIRVPAEIVLFERPVGGLQDYTALLNASGRTQPFAYTSPETKPAFAIAGDVAAVEVFALLFESLLLVPEFLDEYFHVASAATVAERVHLWRAYEIRRDAGLARFEAELLAARVSGSPRERFTQTMEEALHVRAAPARYLADVEDGLRSADRLRARAFEVGLRDVMMTRYGRRWWSSRKAGELMREIWSTGRELTADELASELGVGALAFEALEEDVLGGLKA